LNRSEHWSHARLATLTKWLISTQCAQWMLTIFSTGSKVCPVSNFT